MIAPTPEQFCHESFDRYRGIDRRSCGQVASWRTKPIRLPVSIWPGYPAIVVRRRMESPDSAGRRRGGELRLGPAPTVRPAAVPKNAIDLTTRAITRQIHVS